MKILSRNRILLILAALAAITATRVDAQTQPPHGNRADRFENLEANTQRDLLKQPAGLQPLETHNLPPEFVRRVADRIIRMQFQQALRAVHRPDASTAEANAAAAHTPTDESGHAGSSPLTIVVIALILVAIAAVTHRKPVPQTKPSGKRRRK